MKIFIERVENGAEYEQKLYDFWIHGKVLTGDYIKIFDFLPFDLRDKVGTVFECLVEVGFLSLVQDLTKLENVIYGEIVEELEILEGWRLFDSKPKTKKVGLITINGTYILNQNEVTDLGINIGDSVYFRVGRFDLIGIKLGDFK